MHHFAYRDRVLHAEAVNLAELADIVGTPFYCYSSATIERHYNVFAAAFADVDALVCYALKANSNQAVVTTLARLRAGADVASPPSDHASAPNRARDLQNFTGVSSRYWPIFRALRQDAGGRLR